MKQEVEIEQIEVVLTLPVNAYEDLLAAARIINSDIDFVVEALIECYSREFVKDMMRER